MPHRSPARFLAPVALVLAFLTVFLVARSELGSDSPASSGTSTTARNERSDEPTKARTSPTRKRSTSSSGATGGSGARTYTVKPGDVLGSISESTGVPVADLLEYNGIDDAQSLSVGQKLKLRP